MRKLWLPFLLATVSLASAQNTRHFTFHYGFTVKTCLRRKGASLDSGRPLG